VLSSMARKMTVGASDIVAAVQPPRISSSGKHSVPVSHPQPSREIFAELLRLLANPAELSKPVLQQLTALAQPLVEWAVSKSMTEVERISCAYGVMLCVFAHAVSALPSDAAVASIASFLSTVALSGAPLWSDSGWLSDSAPANNPVQHAASMVTIYHLYYSTGSFAIHRLFAILPLPLSLSLSPL